MIFLMTCFWLSPAYAQRSTALPPGCGSGCLKYYEYPAAFCPSGGVCRMWGECHDFSGGCGCLPSGTPNQCQCFPGDCPSGKECHVDNNCGGYQGRCRIECLDPSSPPPPPQPPPPPPPPPPDCPPCASFPTNVCGPGGHCDHVSKELDGIYCRPYCSCDSGLCPDSHDCGLGGTCQVGHWNTCSEYCLCSSVGISIDCGPGGKSLGVHNPNNDLKKPCVPVCDCSDSCNDFDCGAIGKCQNRQDSSGKCAPKCQCSCDFNQDACSPGKTCVGSEKDSSGKCIAVCGKKECVPNPILRAVCKTKGIAYDYVASRDENGACRFDCKEECWCKKDSCPADEICTACSDCQDKCDMRCVKPLKTPALRGAQ